MADVAVADQGPPAVLQLLDTAGAGAAADVLGLWAAPPTSPADVAFDMTPGSTAQPPVWRVVLPADPRLAAACLSDAEAALGASQRALAGATSRLEAFARASAGDPPGDVAFELPDGRTGQGQPEATLIALLREVRTDGEVAFGVGEQLATTWDQVGRQFQAFMDRLARAVAHYAWVETYAGDQRLGWTVVGWSGDLDTLWPAGIDPERVALHERALALALSSRATLLRTFVQAAKGAAIVSTALTTPLGPVLALPAAWKFVDGVLADRQQQQEEQP